MPVYDPLDALFERRRTEVDQQAKREVQEAQVGEKLLGVNRCKILHGLEFHDQAVGHEQIHAQPFVKSYTVEIERDGFLALHPHTLFLEHARQHCFVDGLKQPRPEVSMQVERRVHHHCGRLLRVHSLPPLRVLRGFV